MSNDINDIDYKRPGKGKMFAGIILLAVGAALLLRQLDWFFFPSWLISWPMCLIVWGLYVGAKHDFRNPSWFILILVGVAFLLQDIIPGFAIHEIIWPVVFIAFGLWMILKRNHSWDRKSFKKDWENKWDWRNNVGKTPPPVTDYTTTADSTSSTVPPLDPPYSQHTGDDYIDAVSVFGGVKKIILSKDFKGGDIVNIFGGAEIDMTQADINGRVVIDITQLFGGTKIIVPSHWQVVSDLAAVFASVDDKRIRRSGSGDANKILVLKGVSIFAGVDIRSY